MKTILKLSLLFTLLLVVACGSDDDASCTEQTWYLDADADDFGNLEASQSACTQPVGYVTDNTDLDDNNASVFPNATEICDGIDNDGDGQVDGLTSSNCAAGEVCENGSCVAAITYYFDADADGFGDASNFITAGSSAPTNYVLDNTDCDDSDPTTNPGATENTADGIDNDCDGEVDECTNDAACNDGDASTYDYCENGYCVYAIICANDGDCPTGMTCVDIGGVSVCQ